MAADIDREVGERRRRVCAPILGDMVELLANLLTNSFAGLTRTELIEFSGYVCVLALYIRFVSKCLLSPKFSSLLFQLELSNIFLELRILNLQLPLLQFQV